ncbi:MAG: GYD domain-containing protein [Planctomycetes bacterium]|nr:GYD domain-containing protein [Planctomycetota bacterium]
MKAFCLTMGSCDGAVIGEFPNDEACAKAALMIGSAGAVPSKTLRAFTEDEYRKLSGSLP